MISFLAGKEIADAVSRNLTPIGPTDLAVAYWGCGGAKILGLTRAHKNVRVICDLWSLACDPEELQKLLDAGFELRTRDGIHAKVGELVDMLHRIGCKRLRRTRIGRQDAVRIVLGMDWDSTTRDHACEATHGICAAAEPDQEYPIARSPEADQRRVAIDDVARDAEPVACAMMAGSTRNARPAGDDYFSEMEFGHRASGFG
jgi:hypothetical protein